MSVIAPCDIVVDHPTHPAPGAKLVVARQGRPVPPQFVRHPAVLEALSAVAKEPESDLADVDGGSYDGKEWTVDKLKKELADRGVEYSDNARKADLIEALEADDSADYD